MASPELTNPRALRVKDVRRLTNRGYRHQRRRFLAEGAQAAREALVGAKAGHVVVHDLFVSRAAAERHPDLADLAAATGVTIQVCTEAVIAAVSDTVTPQGLVAVCEFLDRPAADVLRPDARLVALLAQVRDPGNAGSVLRAADASGADGVVFSSDSVDAYNGKVVRASVGGIFHLPVATDVPVVTSVHLARTAGLQVVAADRSGAVDLDQAEHDGTLARPTAWLFGNEAWGLDEHLRESADVVVRIPIYGMAESLNLATAATLCLYASARSQRSSAGRRVDTVSDNRH